jgi:hypothetical protein
MNIIDWIKEQWQEMTLEHITYLIVFSIFLTYITNHILKIKNIKWLYYGLFVILMINLVRGGHPVGAVETVYKLILI